MEFEAYLLDIIPKLNKNQIELLVFLSNSRAINVNKGKSYDEIIKEFSEEISRTKFFTLIKPLEIFGFIESVRQVKTLYFLSDYGVMLINTYLRKYLKK